MRKLAVYAREAVAHVWFVDPALQTLEVFRLEGARWVLVGSYAGDEVVRAEPFDGDRPRVGPAVVRVRLRRPDTPGFGEAGSAFAGLQAWAKSRT